MRMHGPISEILLCPADVASAVSEMVMLLVADISMRLQRDVERPHPMLPLVGVPTYRMPGSLVGGKQSWVLGMALVDGASFGVLDDVNSPYPIR